ncbi:DNA-binding protein [Variovorax paradoxus]|nr:DNA-binding protein [Variovorax paradoxus]
MAGQGLRPLARQVAWVMFFEYQELPTANAIRNLLKQRSLTTCVSEVRMFWDALRQQVQDGQTLAGLPEALSREISQGVNRMWRLALEHAQGGLQLEQQAAMDVMTPLSRLSIRMAELEAERDRLKAQLADRIGEKSRIDGDSRRKEKSA